MTNVPAATQSLRVLRLLGRHAAPLPAVSIARELGLPRSKTYHLLQAMTAEGFVVHLPEQRRYGLGVSAYELGFAYTRQEPLRWIAGPALSRLVRATGENGHFAILDGHDVVYVIEERAVGRASLVTEVGVRLPAHVTASGLSMLAALPDPQVRALYPRRSPELRRAIAQARADGYATEDGSVTAGFASVASMVGDHRSHPVAAVALTFAAGQVPPAERPTLAERVRRTALLIARGLSG